MKKSLLIFDLDGTLLDTLDDLATSLNRALAAFGLPSRSREQVRGFVGNGVRALVRRALPELTAPETEAGVFAAFADHYREHCAERTRPYEGVADLLYQARQRGFSTAVASNKPQREAQALCQRFFPGLLDLAVGERPGAPKKPEPHLLFLVLGDLGFGAEQAVYIGDSQVDVETAARAGVDFLGVSWGFRSREQLMQAGAGEIADSPLEILARLEQGLL